MLKPNFKTSGSCEDSLDKAISLLKIANTILCFVILIIVFACLMGLEVFPVFAVLGAVCVTFLVFAFGSALINYLHVQSEMSRTLKKINTKLTKEEK